MNKRETTTLRGIAGALALGLASLAHAADLPGPLVTVQWLHDHAKEVQIVDIRDDLNSLTADPKYSTVNGTKVVDQVGGYIPDALSANFWALREKRDVNGKTIDFLLPTADEFQEVMRASQLEDGKPVVLAPTGDDATSLQEASFLAWELEVFGMPARQIAILDGGTHAWLAAGYPVDNDAIAPMTSGHWTAKPPRADLLADIAQVEAAQKAHKPLFDARPLAQFAGLSRTPVVPKEGRLADARPLPAELMYRQDADGSWHFLPAAQYKTVFALARMGLPHGGIIYCNTGQYAAGAWFALSRIVGVKGLREYPGGMNEWEQRDLPIHAL